ncbi:nuclear transport factor 2 family protein [Streptomyces endophyticus]|uniref:Nuclear transport factor 2 family protein n=1 Tax=Streptomyces endophyticus TaxID=714166 RepID=A0ABU6FDA6_9ACTN|nr:nuclear transport factor 2 family protein [Streptomyces endophyticus]MEB8341473.1 nuclear transport factor 2 family protein [Streptomyces endophyticus]
MIQASAADELDALERLLAERACERLILELVRRLDLGDPATVCELFTPDGVWEWPYGNRRIEGRQALRGYFGTRPADRLSRRMCTNLLVTVESPDTATATTYFATYRVDGHSGSAIVPTRLPVNVGHYEDTFRKLDGRWLMASRTLVLPFGGPTERVGVDGQAQ